MKDLTKIELRSITGGSIWSPIATVPVAIPIAIVKWAYGFKK